MGGYTNGRNPTNHLPVFIHGVRVQGVNADEQIRAIAAIRDENTQLYPGLKITRVQWPKRTIIERKRYSSLILETASPETANRIITPHLIHEGEIKTCVRFFSRESNSLS